MNNNENLIIICFRKVLSKRKQRDGDDVNNRNGLGNGFPLNIPWNIIII